MGTKSERIVAKMIETMEEKGIDQDIAKAMSFTHRLSNYGLTGLDSVIRAMDTQTAGEGQEFVPTAFSPELIRRVALQRKVAALFRNIQMPTPTYTLPVEGGDPTAYFVPENTADTGQVAVPPSNAGSALVTFTAKKISALVRLSDELDQDSIVPAIPYIQEKLLVGIAKGEELAFINGDTAATHMDANVTASTDVRKSVNGLRKKGLANAAKVDMATFNTGNLRAIREGLGVYGVDPADLVWITSTRGLYKMMGNADVLTNDKFGPNATLLTGQLGNFDGIPIVVSEAVPTNLAATGVNTATGPNDRTVIILAHRSAFLRGDRLQVTLEQDRDITFGQTTLVSRERIDFQGAYAATETPVNIGFNV